MKPPAKDKRPRDRWISPGWLSWIEYGHARRLRGWVREGNQHAPAPAWRTKNEAISESRRAGGRS